MHSDLNLLFRISGAVFKLAVIYFFKGSGSVLKLLEGVERRTKSYSKIKIEKYVNLFIFIQSKLGIRYTCLTYSILLCYILRKSGYDAKINFGANNKEYGHCWVTIGDEEVKMPFGLILKYPEKG